MQVRRFPLWPCRTGSEPGVGGGLDPGVRSAVVRVAPRPLSQGLRRSSVRLQRSGRSAAATPVAAPGTAAGFVQEAEVAVGAGLGGAAVLDDCSDGGISDAAAGSSAGEPGRRRFTSVAGGDERRRPPVGGPGQRAEVEDGEVSQDDSGADDGRMDEDGAGPAAAQLSGPSMAGVSGRTVAAGRIPQGQSGWGRVCGSHLQQYGLQRCPVLRGVSLAGLARAFAILASVVGEKAPEHCSALFCYMDAIGEAYRTYGGVAWWKYDEQLRQRKAVRASIRWDHKDIGLWMRLMVAPKTNLTVVTEFLLLGFQGSQFLRNLLFLLFLVVFVATICGNLLIIILVSTTKNLHTPMYFFISQLSISDILLSTNIVPNLLHILLNNGGTVSFIGCMTQFYFFDCTEALEGFLFAVMSYDRYVAICNPLRYSSVMTNRFCVTSLIISWLMGNVISFIVTITSSKLNFCGSNIINHFFCEIIPLLDLSCSATFSVHVEIFVLGVPSIMVATSIIVVSYTYIVISVLRIQSITGRQKAFSTCSSHLIVVSIFYWTLFSVYVFPKREQTWVSSKILSLLYTVFTPFINPIIYSLRNKDIKKAVQQTLHKHISCNKH
ncbi:olfactory receptor 1030-like [Bufo bufo]|uniref:olfactory receptor 1030-like n=1 Tax=Bufo bufo TaxID=8384 RepID=UPI001ABDB5D8|nr:olfactory receptor 1030-like [Bufo bufo]